MPALKAVTQISLHGNSEVFLESEYKQNLFLTLKILNIKDNKAFLGQTSDVDLRTQAARIRLTFSDYLNEVKKALFNFPKTNTTYVYSLQQKDESFIFEWKSVDIEETVINLGSVQMHAKSYVSLFSETLISLSKEIQHLNETINNYAEKFKECKDQTDFALNQLSKANDLKDNLEREMFSKFILVLNEKKKVFKTGKNSTSCQKIISNNKIKKAKLNVISDSSDENEFLGRNKPSTSKPINNSFSFFSDEDDSVVPVKPSKIRNRNTQPKKSAEENVKKIQPKMLIENDDSDDSLFKNL